MVKDHVEALLKHLPSNPFHFVLANDRVGASLPSHWHVSQVSMVERTWEYLAQRWCRQIWWIRTILCGTTRRNWQAPSCVSTTTRRESPRSPGPWVA